MAMFKTDNAKPGAKADAEKEKDTARVRNGLCDYRSRVININPLGRGDSTTA